MSNQVNLQGHIIDEELLKKNRIQFAIAAGLSTGISGGLGIATKIVQLLGGGDQHLGILFSASGGGMGNLFQFTGSLLLKTFRSYRRSMVSLMLAMLCFNVLSILTILSIYVPSVRSYSLYVYLFLGFIGAIIGGGVWNIESCWIGALVSKNRIGWFSSLKWIIVNIAIFGSNLAAAKFGDRFPTPGGYALVNLFVFFSHVSGIILFSSVADREPRNLNFVSICASPKERIHYASLTLWCYIAFYIIWTLGRTCLNAFYTVFLFDQFHFSLIKLAWLNGLQLVVSSLMLYLLGKLSDARGNRLIVIVVSAVVALSMMLYVSSAWFGLMPIILYAIINGAAGQTHSMLGMNLAIEIFPDKGRSAYIAFSRIFIGSAGIATPIIAGWLLYAFHDIQVQIYGAILNRYHVLFFIGSLIAFSSVLPLVIMGKRTMREE